MIGHLERRIVRKYDGCSGLKQHDKEVPIRMNFRDNRSSVQTLRSQLIGDVTRALGWVHRNSVKHGGDPNRIFVGEHSAGAQLAALICIDDRYLKKKKALRLKFSRGACPWTATPTTFPR